MAGQDLPLMATPLQGAHLHGQKPHGSGGRQQAAAGAPLLSCLLNQFPSDKPSLLCQQRWAKRSSECLSVPRPRLCRHAYSGA